MAEGKKSFVFYSEWIENFNELTNEESGKLIKHILKYVNDENPELEDRFLKLAFLPIKQALKRDLKKYETYINKQKANGKKGGRPKKEETQKTQAFLEKPKKADNVNVNDNVNDNNIITTTDKLKKIDVVYSEFVKQVKNGEHSQWAEQTYMQLKLKKNTLTNLINDFKSHLIRTETVHESVTQFKTHLNNWLNQLDTIGKLNQYKNQKIGAL